MVTDLTFPPAWSKGIDDLKAGNKSRIKLVSQMTCQHGIFWLAKFSQVQNLSSFLLLVSTLVTKNVNIFHQNLCKVLGNKILPLICLIFILAYWILGLTLPTAESLDDNLSNCTLPV